MILIIILILIGVIESTLTPRIDQDSEYYYLWYNKSLTKRTFLQFKK